MPTSFPVATAQVNVALPTPREAIAYFQRLIGERSVECVVAAHLDAGYRVVHSELVSEGDASAATLPVRAMLRSALLHEASWLLVAHNHPGGDPAPSDGDKAATRLLATAGAALDIRLLDHIVVAPARAFSFRLHGYL